MVSTGSAQSEVRYFVRNACMIESLASSESRLRFRAPGSNLTCTFITFVYFANAAKQTFGLLRLGPL